MQLALGPNVLSRAPAVQPPLLLASASWEVNSYGYHGDDGKKFGANARGEAYGPTFSTGAAATRSSRTRQLTPRITASAACVRACLTRCHSAPPSAGDVVGAGIILSRGDVFFTCVAFCVVTHARGGAVCTR
jgi:hypothetical protein